MTLLLVALLASDAHAQALLDAAALDAMPLKRVGAELPTVCSRGHRAHARDVGDAMGEALAFYEQRLGVELELRVALLGPEDWARVTPVPYGLPLVDQGVAVLPAAGGIVAGDFGAMPLDDARRQRLIEAAGSVDAAVARFVDVIGFHELGHALVGAYGLQLPAKWLDELVATWFAYAFLRAEHPELAVVFDELSQAKADTYSPEHRTLAEFDALYLGVGPADYVWYQSRFERQVQVIYDARGLAFAEDLKAAFPPGAPPPTDAELAATLDRIAPGMAEWMAEFW
jgi:hypothetical protein